MTSVRRHHRGTRLLHRAVLVAALSPTPAVAAGYVMAADGDTLTVISQGQSISDGSSGGAGRAARPALMPAARTDRPCAGNHGAAAVRVVTPRPRYR